MWACYRGEPRFIENPPLDTGTVGQMVEVPLQARRAGDVHCWRTCAQGRAGDHMQIKVETTGQSWRPRAGQSWRPRAGQSWRPQGRAGDHVQGRAGDHVRGRAGDHVQGRAGDHVQIKLETEQARAAASA
ncbi:hypothetical protein NDU88_012835 [Pleurodeles waltl]|uniref:Uncharacterized protein n=1 Tax=Pleurodeles waltl TaxID=8319 RepID=A0AAV7R5S5_PLEWA|nr:hypothetical protein NDU88_012835 [Pleurodeles waltl]